MFSNVLTDVDVLMFYIDGSFYNPAEEKLRVLTQEIKGCPLRILLNMSEVRVMP